MAGIAIEIPDGEEKPVEVKMINLLPFRYRKSSTKPPSIKGAGSRNVNKFLSKQRFCSNFDRPYHNDFPVLF